MTGKSHWSRAAKAKGMAFQKKIKESLEKTIGKPLNSTTAGMPGPDVYDLYKNFPIDIECKKTKYLHITGAMNQATANARAGQMPAVVHAKNYDTAHIVMKFNDFLKILQHYKPPIQKKISDRMKHSQYTRSTVGREGNQEPVPQIDEGGRF